jgi:hypothetical protein
MAVSRLGYESRKKSEPAEIDRFSKLELKSGQMKKYMLFSSGLGVPGTST